MHSRKSDLDQGIAPVLLVVFLCLFAAPNSSAGLQSRNIYPNDIGSLRSYLDYAASDGLYCWPREKLPLKVFFEPGLGIPGYKISYPETLADCFDEWVRASRGKLGWVRTTNAQQADILCRWTDQVTEREQGSEAGRTKTFATLNTVTNRGAIHRCEMLLLTRLPEREFDSSEIKKSYLHEVGHAFGITGHSSNSRDIMYFAVSKGQNLQLSAQDVVAINQLYKDYPYLITQSKYERQLTNITN